MPTLVISAPSSKARTAGGIPSIQQIVANGIGPDYAICRADVQKISSGCDLVIVDNPGRTRFEAVITNLVPKTGSGIKRFDVYFKGVRQTPYRREYPQRWGTAA